MQNEIPFLEFLPMRLFGAIKPGMQAEVCPELEDGALHEATVVLVDPMGDAASGTFGAQLSLPHPTGLKCRIQLEDKGPVLSELDAEQDEPPRLAASKNLIQ